MRLDELAEILATAKERGLPDDTEVIFGQQLRYPFGTSIDGWCLDHTFRATFFKEKEPRTVIVLTEGRQLSYGNRDWWSGEDIEDEDEAEAEDEGAEDEAEAEDEGAEDEAEEEEACEP